MTTMTRRWTRLEGVTFFNSSQLLGHQVATRTWKMDKARKLSPAAARQIPALTAAMSSFTCLNTHVLHVTSLLCHCIEVMSCVVRIAGRKGQRLPSWKRFSSV